MGLPKTGVSFYCAVHLHAKAFNSKNIFGVKQTSKNKITVLMFLIPPVQYQLVCTEFSPVIPARSPGFF